MIQSTLKMQMDFERKVPVIEIIHRPSDETVDHLLSAYLQSQGHCSRWLRIEYQGEFKGGYMYRVFAVTPNELSAEVKLMQATIQTEIGIPPAAPRKEGRRPWNRLDLMSPAEKAITHAMQEVEKAGGSIGMTNAIIKLDEARRLVYEYLEGLETQPENS